MNERHEWDDHTRSIVESRLRSNDRYRFLTVPEAETLRTIASLLVHDGNPEVLGFMLHHVDQTLSQTVGESQRKAGVPPAPELVRAGLKAIEQASLLLHATSFPNVDILSQKKYLRDVSEGIAEPQHIWSAVPQKEWFRKLCDLAMEAYCSHPIVWSEIGYAGPAYPRGYVRTQLGQLDPWEAQPEP